MKKTTKMISIMVEKTETGFSAYSNNFPIFMTTGGKKGGKKEGGRREQRRGWEGRGKDNSRAD
ncbi:MAG: hypothetical protein U5K79_05665 [Cyclobacteriaceae bacterium]|nr:hypothetical protein [Cyclobacteriaceae bacterium]